MYIEEERNDSFIKLIITLSLKERIKLLFSHGMKFRLGNFDYESRKKIHYHIPIDLIPRK